MAYLCQDGERFNDRRYELFKSSRKDDGNVGREQHNSPSATELLGRRSAAASRAGDPLLCSGFEIDSSDLLASSTPIRQSQSAASSIRVAPRAYPKDKLEWRNLLARAATNDANHYRIGDNQADGHHKMKGKTAKNAA